MPMGRKERRMNEVTDFPKHWCGNCQLRIYFARHYDIHLDWKDCPYKCGYKEEMRELEKKEKSEDPSRPFADSVMMG